MLRVRFRANPDDPRPVVWPIKHPYWITGYGEDYAIVVAYVDSMEELDDLWPDATDVDADEADEYVFTDRFQKPEWFKA